jgi:hypothetical protein
VCRNIDEEPARTKSVPMLKWRITREKHTDIVKKVVFYLQNVKILDR